MNGVWIKDWRLERGLTQEQLAALLFVAPNTVARWERGELEPSGWLLLAILGIGLKMAMDRKKAESSPRQRRYRRPRTRQQADRDATATLREAAAMVAIDSTRFRELLQLCHPDKHANSKTATEVTAWLNQLRRRP